MATQRPRPPGQTLHVRVQSVKNRSGVLRPLGYRSMSRSEMTTSAQVRTTSTTTDTQAMML